jgi:HNH endonuclease
MRSYNEGLSAFSECGQSMRVSEGDSVGSRTAVPHEVAVAVLAEAGYRCAAPTCRTILTVDPHYIVELSERDRYATDNLVALCPTCHGMFQRGVLGRDSIYTWKSVLVSMNQAFDTAIVDHLLFLQRPEAKSLRVSGDGVLQFSRLVSAGLATFGVAMQNGPLILYWVTLTSKGKSLVEAWTSGNREAVARALQTA